MEKAPLIFMSLIGVIGYAVFHGHRTGQDCFLCKYRGLTFMGGSAALGTWLAFQEKE